ncbi:alpha/beta hydrolase [Flavobacterium ginsenosidimutans]|uniref:Alpha/beta hydrolase n=1 Tax=Flavobacterium ginsenosidimutans TaxID=687844 RepID=A0ABZ2Q486_9FLAO
MNYSLIRGIKKGTIVFIHGNSSSSEVFKDIMNSNKITQSKLALDLPGHGKSTDIHNEEEDFTMKSYSEKIISILNQIDDDILICGNSLGGHIAIEISKRITRLKGLVIFGTPPLKKPLNFEEAILPMSELQIYSLEYATDLEIETAVNIIVFNKKVVDIFIKSYKETNPKIRKALANDFANNNWSNQFEIFTNLTIPKFIIAGAHDTCIKTEYLLQVVNNSKGICELIIIKGCGHYPSIEQPLQFIDIIKKITAKVFT